MHPYMPEAEPEAIGIRVLDMGELYGSTDVRVELRSAKEYNNEETKQNNSATV